MKTYVVVLPSSRYRILFIFFLNSQAASCLVSSIFESSFPPHRWCCFNKCCIALQGTEYYDGKTKRYVDFPITDILQMMGRAGRPQYDQHGKAVILVHEPKKSFYKKVELEVVHIYNDLSSLSTGHDGKNVVLCL